MDFPVPDWILPSILSSPIQAEHWSKSITQTTFECSAQVFQSMRKQSMVKLSTVKSVIVRYYVTYPTQIDGKNTKGYQL